MKFFIDTADLGEIRAAAEMGLIDGVTTNPSLLMPRGARLTAPEACAVGRWVAVGAPGPDGLVDAGIDAAGAMP